MAADPEIEYLKSKFRGLPTAELERKRARSLPTSAEHKAAHDLLTQNRETLDEQRHRQSLARADRANCLALAAFLMAVLALAVAGLALLRDFHGWEKATPEGHPQKETVPPP